MGEQDPGRLASWARVLSAAGGLIGKLVWFLVVVVILTALGRYLYLSSAKGPETEGPDRPRATAPMPAPVDWGEVDRALVAAFAESRLAAQSYASKEIDRWTAELEVRMDRDFLEWYFSYLQQQWLGLKAVGYWTSAKVLDDQPTVAERITEDIQEEFSKRVLRPQIAQMRVERIVDGTLTEYVRSLQETVDRIPERYDVPHAEWERYLADIAVLTSVAEGNRRVSLSLKTLAASTAVGGIAGGAYLLKSMKGAVSKIGSVVSAKTAAKGAGKAAAKLAAKTGSKVGAKAGGKFLGPIVGIGILVWDVWDHNATKKVERPLLRQALMEYLEEMKYSLLHDPETGIMSLIGSLETTMVSSLTDRQAGAGRRPHQEQ